MYSSRFLLDTNICIYIRQGRPPSVIERFSALLPGEAVISVINYGELAYGAEKSRERDRALARLQEFLAIIPALALPTNAGAAYARLRADLERSGKVISSNDLWIAAHALAAGLTLVTNNEREFGRVEGLNVENWAAPSSGPA